MPLTPMQPTFRSGASTTRDPQPWEWLVEMRKEIEANIKAQTQNNTLNSTDLQSVIGQQQQRATAEQAGQTVRPPAKLPENSFDQTMNQTSPNMPAPQRPQMPTAPIMPTQPPPAMAPTVAPRAGAPQAQAPQQISVAQAPQPGGAQLQPQQAPTPTAGLQMATPSPEPAVASDLGDFGKLFDSILSKEGTSSEGEKTDQLSIMDIISGFDLKDGKITFDAPEGSNLETMGKIVSTLAKVIALI